MRVTKITVGRTRALPGEHSVTVEMTADLESGDDEWSTFTSLANTLETRVKDIVQQHREDVGSERMVPTPRGAPPPPRLKPDLDPEDDPSHPDHIPF